MDTKHKISIPEPCDKNWDKMTPKDNGRFCLSCSKTVVDFTKMLSEEIQHFFIQNQNDKICGRFKKSQLDTITIQIPTQVLYSQTNYYKMFLLALFIAMGTTLFSCADKEGNKKKIDKVEVVEKASKEENLKVGKALKNDTTAPPPKVDKVKFVKPAENTTQKNNKKTASHLPSSAKSAKKSEAKETDYFTTGMVSQVNAEFPGGIEQFYNYFGKEFQNPENITNANKKFRISFAVERDGSLTYLESTTGIDQTVEKEVIRVLKLCPKWQPGESGGKKIKMQYSLPIVLQ